MRHRIAVIGTSECTRSVALLLVARDDSHVLLTGEDAAGLQAAAVALAVEPRVEGPVAVPALTAADIVVVCDGEAAPAVQLRLRCPDALLVIATPEPAVDAAALQATLRWPRQRVIGVDAAAAAGPPAERAAAAVRLVDHILADRGRTVEATVQTTAAGGPGSWASVPVRVGAVGVQALDVAPPAVTAAAASA
jgi:malate/lactate dehydrogenase